MPPELTPHTQPVNEVIAEDDGSGGPRSVREKTALVEQFVLAQGSGSGRRSPPRVKFHWDRLIVKGVITSVAVDFEEFISIFANGEETKIHTSCSQPLEVGMDFGPFTLTAGASLKGALRSTIEALVRGASRLALVDSRRHRVLAHRTRRRQPGRGMAGGSHSSVRRMSGAARRSATQHRSPTAFRGCLTSTARRSGRGS